MPEMLQGGTLGLTVNVPQIDTTQISNDLKNASVKATGKNPNGSGGFLQNANWGAIGSGIDSAFNSFESLWLDRSDQNQVGQAVSGARDQAASALMKSGNPWAMAAGAAIKAIDATGGFADQSQGLGSGNDVGNAIMGFVPGSGWFAKKTDNFKVNDRVQKSSGFGGSVSEFEKTQGNAGKKLIFGRGKANRQITNAKIKQNKIADTLTLNDELLESQASTAADISQQNMFNQMGGWSAGGVQFGAEGLKLKDRSKIRELAEKARKRRLEEVASFKAGGKIGDQSVIPGGALHARKHQLGEYNENLANQVTHKGVPVVSFEFGGEVEQHAEIERGEIIFRKEITDKLEELWRDGSEEAALEAGKLIAEEIINNTIDNSGEYEIENKEQDIYS